MTSALEDLLRRHMAAGTVPGAIGLLGVDGPDTLAVGVAAVGARRCVPTPSCGSSP